MVYLDVNDKTEFIGGSSDISKQNYFMGRVTYDELMKPAARMCVFVLICKYILIQGWQIYDIMSKTMDESRVYDVMMVINDHW